MSDLFVCFLGVFRLLKATQGIVHPALWLEFSQGVILAFPLYMYLDWPRPGLSSGVPNFWGLSSVLSEALGKSYDLLLFHFLPSCQMGINNLTYLLGGRESSENGVILSVQVLKVVLLGEQSDWNWLVYYKPYTPLFHSLGAVTWSVSFWGSIQRKLLTWPQVLWFISELNTNLVLHLRSCPFLSLSPILSECCFFWLVSYSGGLWGWVLKNPVRWEL